MIEITSTASTKSLYAASSAFVSVPSFALWPRFSICAGSQHLREDREGPPRLVRQPADAVPAQAALAAPLAWLFGGGGRGGCPVVLRQQALNPVGRNDPTARLRLRPTGHPPLPLPRRAPLAPRRRSRGASRGSTRARRGMGRSSAGAVGGRLDRCGRRDSKLARGGRGAPRPPPPPKGNRASGAASASRQKIGQGSDAKPAGWQGARRSRTRRYGDDEQRSQGVGSASQPWPKF